MAQKRRYRIKPGSKHYMRGYSRDTNIFREGDVLELYPHQAKPIMDKLIPLDADEPSAQTAAVTGPKNEAQPHRLQHVGGGRYNVINPVTGVKVNDETLTKDEAEALITGDDGGDQD